MKRSTDKEKKKKKKKKKTKERGERGRTIDGHPLRAVLAVGQYAELFQVVGVQRGDAQLGVYLLRLALLRLARPKGLGLAPASN